MPLGTCFCRWSLFSSPQYQRTPLDLWKKTYNEPSRHGERRLWRGVRRKTTLMMNATALDEEIVRAVEEEEVSSTVSSLQKET